MTLTVLADNRTSDNRLMTEHGLSILLDTGKMKVLLDTGASDVFVRNAALLGKELSDVDYVFLSHGHKDHTGGLEHILACNQDVKIIVSSNSINRTFFSSRGGMHDISPEWPLEKMTDMVYADRNMVEGGMHVITEIECRHAVPKADRCLYIYSEDGYVQDDFKHEIALYIDGLLFTGCAHKGLLNILESCDLPIHTVVGGFHLLDESGDDYGFETLEELAVLADTLVKDYPDVNFFTGHCTSDEVFSILRKSMGDRLQKFSCGMNIELNN